MPSQVDVEAFRATTVAVGDAAVADLTAVWGSWGWDDPFSVRGAASLVVPDVVWTYQGVAGGYAADQYDEWRELERVRGRFVASPAALAAEDQVLAGVRNAVGSLFGASPDVDAARSLLAGSVARHVMHGATDTIVGATRADPQAAGGVVWRGRLRAGSAGCSPGGAAYTVRRRLPGSRRTIRASARVPRRGTKTLRTCQRSRMWRRGGGRLTRTGSVSARTWTSITLNLEPSPSS